MTPELRAKLQSFGRDLTPEALGETRALFAARNHGLDPATQVSRDHAYGNHERQRLDLFRREGMENAPVLLFVHGGGFTMGDKHVEGSPFYSNIGDFAARHAMLGAVMTYRLAPEHRFPSGLDDMAGAVDWLRGNAAEHGGDPGRIVVMGQSAGAAHVANYLAHRRDHARGIAGAVLMSGMYDAALFANSPTTAAYYGEDRAAWGAASSLAGLLASDIPMQFSVAEFDPLDFHRQAAQLAGEWLKTHERYPELHFLSGHNHLSPALTMGSDQRETERMVAAFVARVTSS